MRITQLELRNFKRFTHLSLEGIPPSARLVLLIGSNGSGKSCIFDAFEVLNKPKRKEGQKPEWQSYYRKVDAEDFRIIMATDKEALWDIQVTGANFFDPQIRLGKDRLV